MSLPSRLGRYAVRRRIGAGGFATVWLAYDEQLDSPVAVKVLAENWTEDHHVRHRFIEEGRFLRKVDSPHVVGVYDAGELDDGRPYLVMSYADQGSLADRLKTGLPSVGESVEVIRQIALGLAALHQRDVLHRDVKPANVLFRTVEDGGVRAMIGDLGLGKALDMSSRLTMIAGTPTFVAPEQARGEALDARADQYSLGVLAFLMLTGRTPYSHSSLAVAAASNDVALDWGSAASLPAAARATIERALAVDREQRWPDVLSFASALSSSLDGLCLATPTELPLLDSQLTRPGVRPSPAPAPVTAALDAPAPRRLLPALLAVLGLVVGAAAGYAAWLGRDPTVTLSDERGTVSVMLPRSLAAYVDDEGWTPVSGEGEFPALSAGSSSNWATSGDRGIFVGILPATELPETMPQHPECESADEPVPDVFAGDPSVTVVHSGCGSAGLVTVERVVQVAGNRLLWVQVRTSSRSEANALLETVITHGL